MVCLALALEDPVHDRERRGVAPGAVALLHRILVDPQADEADG
eukprot:CAMPEP_0174940390 /NCGR_PEP_ID=MMETSP1355-20121228/69007_1 /TAXON_ID=464990 /ORGANISM="Hemiselmis tepida, Strain CCMP443" /LENGTH=42 /DNA_ID= /DNA_START= /DNA_END= /DNA_ORIENTATION=